MQACENRIALWKPGKTLTSLDSELKPADSDVTKIHEFELQECDIWFMRFSIDFFQTVHQHKTSQLTSALAVFLQPHLI